MPNVKSLTSTIQKGVMYIYLKYITEQMAAHSKYNSNGKHAA